MLHEEDFTFNDENDFRVDDGKDKNDVKNNDSVRFKCRNPFVIVER